MSNSENITFVTDLTYENNISEIYTYYPKSCTVKVLQEVGPGGGWPECEISGPKADIYEYLGQWLDTDEIDFMVYGE